MSDTETVSGNADTPEQPPPPALSPALEALRVHIEKVLPSVSSTTHRGELTLETPAADLLDVLRRCRDDEVIGTEMLADVSAVHWPAGISEDNSQETTGWPTYTEVTEQGRIDVSYILRSLKHNHSFRIRVALPDEDPTIDSATAVWSSANFLEREVYDLMGVTFTGHPNLTRIMMPDDWEGHPHRKDYPLGGVEVMYKGQTVPPPDEREY